MDLASALLTPEPNWPGFTPLRLTDVHYDDEGRLTYPHHADRADETVLPTYFEQARALLADRPEGVPDVADGVMAADFDALRWFPLPEASIGVSRNGS